MFKKFFGAKKETPPAKDPISEDVFDDLLDGMGNASTAPIHEAVGVEVIKKVAAPHQEDESLSTKPAQSDA